MGEEGLFLKYFVLKPKGSDIYAKASRNAMLDYARTIEVANPNFAEEIRSWAYDEETFSTPKEEYEIKRLEG